MLISDESVMVYRMASEKYVGQFVFGEDLMDDQQAWSQVHRPPWVGRLLRVDGNSDVDLDT